VEYPGNDDADLINILSSIEEVDIAVIFIEQRGGKVKVSWRAAPGLDVSGVALSFGGGGHPAAAGAEIAGSLEEVQTRVLQATTPLLELV
jgi:phosphoesterase RecJ-like protein